MNTHSILTLSLVLLLTIQAFAQNRPEDMVGRWTMVQADFAGMQVQIMKPNKEFNFVIELREDGKAVYVDEYVSDTATWRVSENGDWLFIEDENPYGSAGMDGLFTEVDSVKVESNVDGRLTLSAEMEDYEFGDMDINIVMVRDYKYDSKFELAGKKSVPKKDEFDEKLVGSWKLYAMGSESFVVTIGEEGLFSEFMGMKIVLKESGKFKMYNWFGYDQEGVWTSNPKKGDLFLMPNNDYDDLGDVMQLHRLDENELWFRLEDGEGMMDMGSGDEEVFIMMSRITYD